MLAMCEAFLSVRFNLPDLRCMVITQACYDAQPEKLRVDSDAHLTKPHFMRLSIVR